MIEPLSKQAVELVPKLVIQLMLDSSTVDVFEIEIDALDLRCKSTWDASFEILVLSLGKSLVLNDEIIFEAFSTFDGFRSVLLSDAEYPMTSQIPPSVVVLLIFYGVFCFF